MYCIENSTISSPVITIWTGLIGNSSDLNSDSQCGRKLNNERDSERGAVRKYLCQKRGWWGKFRNHRVWIIKQSFYERRYYDIILFTEEFRGPSREALLDALYYRVGCFSGKLWRGSCGERHKCSCAWRLSFILSSPTVKWIFIS